MHMLQDYKCKSCEFHIQYLCEECEYQGTTKYNLSKHIQHTWKENIHVGSVIMKLHIRVILQSEHESKNNTCEGCDYKAAGIYSQYLC